MGPRALLLAAGLVVASGCGAAPAPAPVASAGPVGHAGRWLTDAQGRVLLLHGVNLVAKNPPYYPNDFGFDDADAAWLARGGMRVVRLGVLASGEMPTRGKIDQNYIDNLLATVDDLARHHIFVLLDWHQDDYGPFFGGDGMPGWMTLTDGKPDRQAPFPFDYTTNPALQQAFQSFWDDALVPGGKPLQSYYVEMLKAVAARVANDPWVLGYEVMNEPWPGNSWSGCLSGTGCSQLEASELEPFYTKAATAIRAVDRYHLIFFEPFVLFNFGLAPTHLALPRGITGDGLAFHQYAQSPAAAEQVYTNALSWSHASGGALLNTEWSSDYNDPATIPAQAADADTALMPWTYWVFDNCNSAFSTPQGANFLLRRSDPPSGSNVNTPLVSGVERPYPFAVAGTPASLAYDPASRVMRFTWSNARAGGGRFGPGARSFLAVPAINYPHGYRVAVSGCRVVSSPDSPTLVVEQQGHPTTASVVVSPA